jgi:polyketide biosynthesis acyl carrier protein
VDDQAVFVRVRENLLEVVPDIDPSEVSMDTSLADLGCNSIDRAEVVTMTMADLGIEVPVMEFQGVGNIRGLVTLLARHA